MYDDLSAIINIQYSAAGAMGGLVHAFRVPKASPWQRVGYIITGAIAANFIVPQLLVMMKQVPSGFVAFGIGMSGKHICYGVELFFRSISGKTHNE